MIQPHELVDMRIAADKAPHDVQQKFHALLDAYEDQEEQAVKLDESGEQCKALERKADDAARTLRGVYPASPSARAVIAKEFGEPLPEDAWAERLADCRMPEERAAVEREELNRARAAEAKLRVRVEALETAVEDALGDLE